MRLRWRKQLGLYLNHLNLVGEGVEVGVHTGSFSYALLEQWQGEQLYLVDPWRHLSNYYDKCNSTDAVMERRLAATVIRLRRFYARHTILRAESLRAVTLFRDLSLDFVYLDANHSYEAVRQDLFHWYPKIRRGGLLCGHDYFDAITDEEMNPIITNDVSRKKLTSYGVKSAVDEFVLRKDLHVVTTVDRLPTWLLRKPPDSNE